MIQMQLPVSRCGQRGERGERGVVHGGDEAGGTGGGFQFAHRIFSVPLRNSEWDLVRIIMLEKNKLFFVLVNPQPTTFSN